MNSVDIRHGNIIYAFPYGFASIIDAYRSVGESAVCIIIGPSADQLFFCANGCGV